MFLWICIISNPYLLKSQNQDFQSFIESYLTTFPDHCEVAIGIVDGDQTYRFGYKIENGIPLQVDNANTLFAIASITKVFTAALLMKEVEKGTMTFDDPIQKYLPVKIKQDSFKNQTVTLLHLVTHTSGLRNRPLMGYKRYERHLENFKLNYIPGQNWEYNNLAVSLLGKMIIDVNRTIWTDLLRSALLTPLGMHNTYANIEETPKMGRIQCISKNGKGDCYFRETAPFNWTAGGMVSNVNDMMKWLKANLDKNSIDTNLQFIHGAHSPLADTIAHSWSYNNYPGTQGIIWSHQRTGPVRRYISHSGANPGQSSFIAFDKENIRGMVILLNVNGQNLLTEDKIFRSIDLTYKILDLPTP